MAIIKGGGGDDFLPTKKRGDILLGLDGDDTLVALHGFNILLGGEGDDRLTALSSFNILSGGAGDDTLRADRSWNLLYGGDGDDDLSSSSDYNTLSGGEGNDSLSVLAGSGNALDGGAGDDLFNVFGGSGNTVSGGAGSDTVSYAGTTLGVVVNLAAGIAAGAGTLSSIENVIGGEGNDIITGDDNDNVLEGGGGDDTIEGGAGNDTVDGGAGDDLIIGGEGAGDDIYQGGDGSDTVSYASTSQGVTANLAAEMATGVEIGTDTLIDIENVIGGTGNDTLTGNANSNVLDGGAGNDLLNGGAGNDTLDGWEGNDYLLGGEGNDTLLGGAGDDRIGSGGGADLVDGGDGVDTLLRRTSSGATSTDLLAGTASGGDTLLNMENVSGSVFNDTIQGNDGANVLSGWEGNDSLTGGNGDDQLLGESGDDTLIGGAGADLLDGGSTPGIQSDLDVVSYFYASSAVTVNLAAGTGAVSGDPADTDTISNIEIIVGSAFADTLTGGNTANDDFERFEGRGGNDTINGGSGFDETFYQNATGPVTVSLSTGIASDGEGGTDALSNIEAIRGSNFADILTGDANNNRFRGQGGADVIDGQGGVDEADYRSSASVNANLVTGFATDSGGTDVLTSIENLRGSSGNDTLVGNSVANLLRGEDGNDTLTGNEGNDILEGGTGNDFLTAGSGIDVINGGENLAGLLGDNDTASFRDAGASVTVNLALGVATIGAETDMLIDIETVIGTDFADILIGGDPKHEFTTDSEQFEGRGGADSIDGGSGNDWALYTSAPLPVVVDLVTGLANDGYGTVDTLANIDRVRGSAFDDQIYGSNNPSGTNEFFEGMAGHDTIDGRGGFDYLRYQTGTAAGVIVNLDTVSHTVGFDTVLAGTARDGFDSDLVTPGVQSYTDTFFNIEGVRGSGFDDTFFGSNNAPGTTEAFEGLGGFDFIDGGGGFDRLEYGRSTSGVSVNLATGTAFDGLGGFDTFVNIEAVRGSIFNDTLTGDAGDNTLEGREGGDFLTGGAGNDTLNGGEDPAGQFPQASDTANYRNTGATTGVTVDLELGIATDGLGGMDTLIDIESVRGTDFADTLIGGNPTNSIPGVTEQFEGRGGNDFINGGIGNDWAIYRNAVAGVHVDLAAGFAFNDGDGGIDTLVSIDRVRGSDFADRIYGSDNPEGTNERFDGRLGHDYIDGRGGLDYVHYDASSGGVVVDLQLGIANADGGQTDTLVNIEGVRGSTFADLLYGSDNATGFEAFEGEAGNDFIDGRGGIDRVEYGQSDAGVSVNLATGTASDGFGTTDTFVNIESVRGSHHNDQLTGNSGDNTLDGQEGMDTLTGGAGLDTLTGGAGNDAFVFSSAPVAGNEKTVTDFLGHLQSGGDLVRLDASFLTGLTQNGTLDPLLFVSGAPALTTTDAQRILYNTATGEVFYDADGSGATTAEKILTLSGAPQVDASDFVVFNAAGAGTQYFWSALVDGQDLSFDPLIDSLNFDAAISAAMVEIETNDTTSVAIFSVGGKTVTFQVSPLALTTANVTFVNGSMLLIGDNSAGTANDNAPNTLVGGGGDDQLIGLGGADSLAGGGGNDLFTVHGDNTGVWGNDTIDGGAGTDRISLPDNAGSGVHVNLATGIATGGAFGSDTLTLLSIEQVTGSSFDDLLISGSGADTLDGWEGNDYLLGGEGNDTLLGGAGDDRIGSGGGADLVDGGDGVDTLLRRTSSGATSTDLLAGTASGGDTLLNMENVSGSVFNDTIQGNDGANVLSGWEGNDSLTGGNGDDQLLGESGDDTLIGGAGADLLDGGSTPGIQSDLDVVSYFYASSAVTVNLAAGTGAVSGDPADTDTISNIEIIVGSAFADTLTGGNTANDDFERFEGRGGNDTINGGSGFDETFYQNATGPVTVSLSTGIASDGEGGTDALSNIEAIRGSNFADILTGDANNNRFRGQGGADVIDGQGGVDEADYRSSASVNANLVTGFATDSGGTDVLTSIENLRGSSGNDTLVGNSVANLLRGEDGNDTLTGNEGNDILEGGTGNDFLTAGSGIDVINGGENLAGLLGDNDTASFRDAGASVTVNLALGVATIGAETDMLIDIETVIGTDFADILIGGDPKHEFTTDSEQFEGRGGADSIDGGSGNDWALYTSAPLPVVVDLVTGLANDGYGTVDTLANIDRVRGSAFDDQIYGSNNPSGTNEFFEGMAGHDTIDGRGGFDYLRYQTGTAAGVIVNLDTVSHTVGFDTVLAGTARDGFDSDLVTPGVQSYTDTFFNIEGVRGSGFDDTFFGSNNAPGTTEAFEGLGGFDFIDGGGGFDRLEYGRSTSGVSVNLATGTAFDGLGGFDTFVNIEAVRGSIFNDTLTGDAGDNTLEGREGGDFLTGGAGNDTLNGGEDPAGQFPQASDTANYRNTGATTGVTVDLELGIATDGLGGMDTLIDIESVRGTDFADTLIGGNPTNSIPGVTEQFEGRGGNDFINGGIGNDWAIYRNAVAGVHVDLAAGFAFNDGDGGIDTLVSIDRVRGSDFADRIYGSDNPEGTNERFDGRLGHDYIDGRGGLDYVHYDASSGGVVVDLQLGIANADGGQTDTLVNIEGVRGSTFADLLYGSDNATGFEAFEGEAGNDFIDGRGGIDRVEYGQSDAGVSVNLATGTASDGFGTTDTFVNIESVRGSHHNDQLTGNSGDNTLDGQEGMDTLTGGAGLDTLTGGAGADVFRFEQSASNNTITDFDGDILDFSPLFTGLGVAAPPGEEPLDWLVNEGYLIVDSSANFAGGGANDTVVQVDVDGSAGGVDPYAVVTLLDVTLGTTGIDADNWLV